MSVGEKPLVEICCLTEIIRDRDNASFGFALEGWGHKDMRDAFRFLNFLAILSPTGQSPSWHFV